MVRLAVTGGIACGKTLVGQFLAEDGVAVWEADEAAHDVMAPGQPVLRDVSAAFGSRILAADGTLDRAALGELVFRDPGQLARLNAIVHPVVREAWRRWLDGLRGVAVAAVIVPLLYEVGEGGGWDAVVCVSAPLAAVMERLSARGLSPADAERRVRAQMPLVEKMERADVVLFNDGSPEWLREQTRHMLRHILEK